MSLRTPEQLLFVYGTLAPGEVNEHVLAPLNGSWELATVCGELVQEGWGADHGFPALRLDEAAKPVSGQLFNSSELANHWDELDEFEGAAYRRVIATVKLDSGQSIAANIYVLSD